MINGHYAGKLDLSEYWAVGDSRTVALSAIPSGTTGESQSAQNIDLVIIGINHDDLSDGSGKSIITVQTKATLGSFGYMNASYSGVGYSLWSTSQRRTWCNSDFKSALPTWLQKLVKSVTKITNRHSQAGYSGQTTTTDDAFLLSECEIYGYQPLAENYGSVGSDGTQYEYMKTTANRRKTSGSYSYWWTRTSMVSGNGVSSFAEIGSNGTDYAVGNCSGSQGIVPAFCL